jgi:Flp pilus assembly pilin Flp
MMTLKLRNLFKSFRADESGAVTVDWVVLTAAIVGLGLVVMQAVGGGVETMTGKIADQLTNSAVGYGN